MSEPYPAVGSGISIVVCSAPAQGGRAVSDHPEPRHCASCGRVMTWRRAWARNWDEVRWCSSACRRRRVRPEDLALEQSIRDLLTNQRGEVDPAELLAAETDARGVSAGEQRESVRRAVRRMAIRGEVEVLQAGRRVDPSTARGPVRVRLLATPSETPPSPAN
jgi:hypothetical protein